jgi:uncharacterized protein (DUF885 family)
MTRQRQRIAILLLVLVLASGCAGAGEPDRPMAEAQMGASSVASVIAGLEGLPLDEFFEESYRQLLLRNPERLTELGLAESYGLRNDRLNDLSDSYIRDTQQLEAAILALLREYDRDGLSPEEQLSYDVYEWYLDDRVRGHEFMYHDYKVHQFLGSYQDELFRLFTEYHPFTDREDAEDYIARLSQVDEQIAQVIEGLRLREEAGVIPPRFIIQMTMEQVARELPIDTLFNVFHAKLQAVEGLDAEEKEALLDSAWTEFRESFIPAYEDLFRYLDHLATVATDDAGVWKLPDGDAYYAYLLRSQTSTDLTPEEIHELGLAEVARIQAEMRQEFEELGYPQDAPLGLAMGLATQQGGFYAIQTYEGRGQLIAAYNAILDRVDQQMGVAFDVRPTADLLVVGDPSGCGGGYYVGASLDRSRPGSFHTGMACSHVSRLDMPTTAYHEAIPGHHFQISLAQELELPLFRNDVFFNGYAEGWALYAERLAWELGLYEGDPYGNLGRLQFELLRAVRLVVDTGIHSMRWTREEAKAYMNEALGDPSGRMAGEVDRYIVDPAQAAGYKVGMLEILELRQRAMDRLGDEFDLVEFHNVVLGSGAVPLEILERLVNDYIEATLEGE